jgi:purine-binding chemotaxis protein CheW
MNEKQYCTFFVNDLLFGVEVLEVQEIMSQHSVEPVPLSPPTVAGLVNHRGQIVTAIDMRRRLGFPAADRTQRSMMLIAHANEETFGLLVDKIGDVLSVNSQDFEPAPETVTGEAKELVLGAYKLPDRLILPLRLDKIAEPALER